MRCCKKCGKEIAEGAAFCVGCGEAVETEILVPTPTAPAISGEGLYKEEQEFLDTTHRLLRWEHKAWRIASKVFIIMGIAYAAFFMTLFLIGLIAVIADVDGAGVFAILGVSYAVIFGSIFIVLGVISKKAGEKIPQYIDTVYTDLSIAYKRCGSVGMMVFTILFGVVSPIFFIINFVRMKSNRAVIERILKNQNVPV